MDIIVILELPAGADGIDHAVNNIVLFLKGFQVLLPVLIRNVENITSSKNRIEEILKTPWIPKSLNGGHISGKGITKKVFFL